MAAPVSADAGLESDAGSHRSAVPEVTFCAACIAINTASAQHGRMREFLRSLLQPLNLAGFFTIAGVALSLRFTEREVTLLSTLCLVAFALFFTLLSATADHRKRLHSVLLVLMAAAALLQIFLAPELGTAQILLVIWVACSFSTWRVGVAVAAALLVDSIFYLLIRDAGFNSPLTMVMINMGFQALAGLCVYYAVNAESSRDQLALVNADLLATRALLADSARDAERLRVARELHDVAGHKLTAMKLNLRALAADPLLAGRSEVMIAQQLSSELLEDIRNVVQALRDARGLDMQTALRALAAPMPRPALLLEIADQVHVADPLIAETILRVVQEAMTNAARHADADTLSVSLRHTQGKLLLDIEDDGRLRGALREGNGLAGMRERIAAADGSLRLSKSQRGGLRLQVELPA